jgi:protein TonB
MMRGPWGIVLFVAAATSFTLGQQTIQSAPSQSASGRPARVKVYSVGRDTIAPQLLPLGQIQIPADACKNAVKGEVILSVLVDETGRLRNVTFIKPLGNALDKFALRVAAEDRFTPGTHNGEPAVFGQTLKMSLRACADQENDDSGRKIPLFRLISQPVQLLSPLQNSPHGAVLAPNDPVEKDTSIITAISKTLGGSIQPPALIKDAPALYTEAAREAKVQGVCIISIVVDRNGLPQDPHVIKCMDYGFGQSAIDSISKYRFRPAMKEDEPVPVRIKVEINFRLY